MQSINSSRGPAWSIDIWDSPLRCTYPSHFSSQAQLCGKIYLTVHLSRYRPSTKIVHDHTTETATLLHLLTPLGTRNFIVDRLLAPCCASTHSHLALTMNSRFVLFPSLSPLLYDYVSLFLKAPSSMEQLSRLRLGPPPQLLHLCVIPRAPFSILLSYAWTPPWMKAPYCWVLRV